MLRRMVPGGQEVESGRRSLGQMTYTLFTGTRAVRQTFTAGTCQYTWAEQAWAQAHIQTSTGHRDRHVGLRTDTRAAAEGKGEDTLTSMAYLYRITQTWHSPINSYVTDVITAYLWGSCHRHLPFASHFLLTHSSPIPLYLGTYLISISAPCCLNVHRPIQPLFPFMAYAKACSVKFQPVESFTKAFFLKSSKKTFIIARQVCPRAKHLLFPALVGGGLTVQHFQNIIIHWNLME